MANHRIKFTTSVLPMYNIDNVDAYSIEKEVINENIRKPIGGTGLITGDDYVEEGGWVNGVPTYRQSNGDTTTVDGNTDILIYQHTGNLYSSSSALGEKCADADTVKIGIHADTSNVIGNFYIAELKAGECFAVPRPSSTVKYVLSNGARGKCSSY